MIKCGQVYTVRFVKQLNFKDGPVTKFSIGTKIKDKTDAAGNPVFQNFGVYCRGRLELQEMDRVVINRIECVSVRCYNGQVMYDLDCEVERSDAPRWGNATDPFEL